MKTIFRKRWYLFVPLIALAFIAFGFVTMYLWNWLMPLLFHLPELTFWQAVGLLILSRILLGGMGGHGHRHGFGHGRHHHMKGFMFEKWEKMTPEEREKFRENLRMHRPPWAHNCSPEE